MEKISIIVPIYNVEQYLDKCVESIVNQTYKNLEILIVDDGSPDKSDAVYEKYAMQDNRIKIIKQKMKELSDCFVCLPGSYGTLDEMMDVVASGTVDEHRKPIYILNYQGFYERLKLQTEHMRKLAFLPHEEQYTPHFINTIDELIQEINYYEKNA